jgi:Nucleoside-diphosphate-sugar pyrophosphorylase involved in lipopolysaccharide biosynthesis/translation initiation factor 2B, gamma/epsilon subunits (eIF-2Bgamma/eIF-2Bepsilon)
VKNLEAIILAGGFGTRLQGIVKDIPKPMADINGKPFLSYVMEYLSKQSLNKILLSVGYKYEIIKDYFGLKYKNMEIEYIIENKPLGTGGAIKEALKHVQENDVLVLNGDSYFNADLKVMTEFHFAHNSLLTIAVKPMYNFERYGSVLLKENRIINFEEKSFKKHGYINGGIYIMNKAISNKFAHINDFFSFEVDFLTKILCSLLPLAFISDEYFIDIGILEDYKKAQRELSSILERNS